MKFLRVARNFCILIFSWGMASGQQSVVHTSPEAAVLTTSVNAPAVQVQPIIYRLDKEILVQIGKCTRKMHLSDTVKPFVLWLNTFDTTEIMLVRYCSSCKASPQTRIIDNSNRFVRISDTMSIPIVPISDMVYTDNLNVVADEGTSRENITITRYQFSGWVIRFKENNGRMKVLDTFYFQH